MWKTINIIRKFLTATIQSNTKYSLKKLSKGINWKPNTFKIPFITKVVVNGSFPKSIKIEDKSSTNDMVDYEISSDEIYTFRVKMVDGDFSTWKYNSPRKYVIRKTGEYIITVEGYEDGFFTISNNGKKIIDRHKSEGRMMDSFLLKEGDELKIDRGGGYLRIDYVSEHFFNKHKRIEANVRGRYDIYTHPHKSKKFIVCAMGELNPHTTVGEDMNYGCRFNVFVNGRIMTTSEFGYRYQDALNPTMFYESTQEGLLTIEGLYTVEFHIYWWDGTVPQSSKKKLNLLAFEPYEEK